MPELSRALGPPMALGALAIFLGTLAIPTLGDGPLSLIEVIIFASECLESSMLVRTSVGITLRVTVKFRYRNRVSSGGRSDVPVILDPTRVTLSEFVPRCVSVRVCRVVV